MPIKWNLLFQKAVRKVIILLRLRNWWATSGKSLTTPELKHLWYVTSVKVKKHKNLFDHLCRTKGILDYKSKKDAPASEEQQPVETTADTGGHDPAEQSEQQS